MGVPSCAGCWSDQKRDNSNLKGHRACNVGKLIYLGLILHPSLWYLGTCVRYSKVAAYLMEDKEIIAFGDQGRPTVGRCLSNSGKGLQHLMEDKESEKDNSASDVGK